MDESSLMAIRTLLCKEASILDEKRSELMNDVVYLRNVSVTGSSNFDAADRSQHILQDEAVQNVYGILSKAVRPRFVDTKIMPKNTGGR